MGNSFLKKNVKIVKKYIKSFCELHYFDAMNYLKNFGNAVYQPGNYKIFNDRQKINK